MRAAAAAAAAVGAVTVAALVAGGGGERLRISAASSLKPAFEAYGRVLDDTPSFSFAGSDELAAQIRRGARPDVYAAADLRLPAALHAEGLVERPVAFARNRLVAAAPAGSDLRDLGDLAGPAVKVAIGARGVPVGVYARRLLARLPAATRAAILANVRSSEPDVAGIVGKLDRRAVDAGFVYRSDIRASRGRLVELDLPPGTALDVVYAAAVVRGARDPQRARAFVAGLRRAAGVRALARSGFVPAAR